MSNPDHESEYEDVSDSEDYGTVNIGTGAIDPRDFRPSAFTAEAEFYVAVLVVESSPQSPDGKPLYEESFVLLKAESEQEAQEKAREYGKQHETSYQNENHELVSWKLKQIVEVKPVEDATFDDGTEIYSRFFRNYSGYQSFEPLLGDDDG